MSATLLKPGDWRVSDRFRFHWVRLLVRFKPEIAQNRRIESTLGVLSLEIWHLRPKESRDAVSLSG